MIRDFRKAGQFQEISQRRRCIMPKCTDAFGNTVSKFIELLILTFEEKMLTMKVGAFNVPMGISCFNRKNAFIGQYHTECVGHYTEVFSCYSNIRFHFTVRLVVMNW